MCTRPLHGLRSCDPDFRDVKFCSDDVKQLRYGDIVYDEEVFVPCGQCIECRLKYSREWAVRCVLESLQSEHNYFLTLTYDDAHLPSSKHYVVDPESGEVISDEITHPLVPDQLSQFMKNFRQALYRATGHTGVRFFGCGEYGSKYSRPHFHLILFNCPLPPDDLVLSGTNFRGDPFFHSKIIDKVWDKGFAVLGEFSYDTAAYVARYVLKKHKGRDSNWYEENGLVPEFTRMSRMPGIAKAYFDENSGEIYHYDKLIVTGSKGRPLKIRPPAYYDRLFEEIDPVSMEEVKEKRIVAGLNSYYERMKRTDLDRRQYLAVVEGNAEERCKKLVRSLH